MSEDQIFAELLNRHGSHTPAVELKIKAPTVKEILRLKQERNAVILGHNYMEPVVYDVADYQGDSLELSRRAAQTTADMIVFCGVKFMAETAKVLNPDKTVLVPSQKAGCSLAAGITAQDVRDLREQFPDVPVVTYINTYADVKAESDVCCTSGNATKVVEWTMSQFGTEKVIFLPDEYLAGNVARETGRRIIYPTKRMSPNPQPGLDYQMIGWHARCEVHEKFTVHDIHRVREEYAKTGEEVLIFAHPECSPEVIAESDYSASTSIMIAEVKKHPHAAILLLTECSMGDNIIASNPDANIIRMCSIRCPHMNTITVENTRDALLNVQYQVDVPEDIRIRAALAVQRMIAIG
ncbi:quinolinate synthase NadA [Candidatus Cerribacteria bacterium 'Amazon FNV 2010 28 9']|uniref:Quinolinate synthase n=1 Tax=Candidatus Cerribacteria bacterium 'Amazon FNV 2010 28 9' TaxID=2081795 RepID=A0A317JRJ1_9BACT|nr:MAG: quinolinate synthase NadA [Candidatus Cerribacteria bacterium 'Amazon FNV 2010 28 9']